VGPIDVRSAALPPLFDPTLPNAPMLFAILEGSLPGRAIADDPDAPTLAAVQSAEGIAFISRTTSQSELDTALSGLRRDAMVGLTWPVDAAGNGSGKPEAPARAQDRLGFGPIPATGERLQALRDDLPAGVTVRPLDADLLARCEWRELVEGAYGSIEAFLEHGIGLCLMRDDEILAEAYAPFIGGGVAEVGVVTAEAHRGQGLAPIAIAWLAAELDERGLAMYWSCDTDNEASVRVAGKLGFGPARPFGILLYRRLTE
jgi:GNAT superfamily N-acetyltransferase